MTYPFDAYSSKFLSDKIKKVLSEDDLKSMYAEGKRLFNDTQSESPIESIPIIRHEYLKWFSNSSYCTKLLEIPELGVYLDPLSLQMLCTHLKGDVLLPPELRLGLETDHWLREQKERQSRKLTMSEILPDEVEEDWVEAMNRQALGMPSPKSPKQKSKGDKGPPTGSDLLGSNLKVTAPPFVPAATSDTLGLTKPKSTTTAKILKEVAKYESQKSDSSVSKNQQRKSGKAKNRTPEPAAVTPTLQKTALTSGGRREDSTHFKVLPKDQNLAGVGHVRELVNIVSARTGQIDSQLSDRIKKLSEFPQREHYKITEEDVALILSGRKNWSEAFHKKVNLISSDCLDFASEVAESFTLPIFVMLIPSATPPYLTAEMMHRARGNLATLDIKKTSANGTLMKIDELNARLDQQIVGVLLSSQEQTRRTLEPLIWGHINMLSECESTSVIMQKNNVDMCNRMQGTMQTCTNTMDHVVKQLKIYTERVTGLSDSKSGGLLRDSMKPAEDNISQLLKQSHSASKARSLISNTSSIAESGGSRPKTREEKLAEARAKWGK